MRTIRIARIAKCPVCGGRPQMLKNAAKQFQVRCTNPTCAFKTGWMRKTDAVISWYNMSNQLRINAERETAEKAKREQAERERKNNA